MKTKTGHPICTELGCRHNGDLSLRTMNPRYVSESGHAVCACHSAKAAELRGVEQFDCGEEANHA